MRELRSLWYLYDTPTITVEVEDWRFCHASVWGSTWCSDGYSDVGFSWFYSIWVLSCLKDLSFSNGWFPVGGFACIVINWAFGGIKCVGWGLICEVGLKMMMAALKAAPRIGCVQMEGRQVMWAMYNCGGGMLNKYLRWGNNMCRAFGRWDEGVCTGHGGCIHFRTGATGHHVTVWWGEGGFGGHVMAKGWSRDS